MIVAAVVLVAMIGWLVVLQTLWVGRDAPASPSRAVWVTTAVLSAAVVVLAVPRFFVLVT